MCASIQSKKARVADQSVLDDLGQSGAQLALGQAGEQIGIDDHRTRLMEGADHVLAAGMIDRGLAAHRRIDVGQQRASASARNARRAGSRRRRSPARSPTTPPPSATTRASRPKRLAIMTSKIRLAVASVLCCSPSGRMTSTPRAAVQELA